MTKPEKTESNDSEFYRTDRESADKIAKLASQIAELAVERYVDRELDKDLLCAFAMIQLRSVVKKSSDIERIRSSPDLQADMAIMVAASFDSNAAWNAVLGKLEAVKPKVYFKSERPPGAATVEDAIDGTIGHLRAEPKTRLRMPSLRVRLCSYKGRSTLKTWLCSVVTNLVRDADKRSRKLSSGDIPETSAPPLPDSAFHMDLKEAKQKLPVADQVFLKVMAAFSESQVEVARFLKVSPSAVSQRKNRILQALRVFLEDYGPAETGAHHD